MFMAMWNTGYQAHLAMQQMGLGEVPGWRGSVITALGLDLAAGGFFSCLSYGALYFLPVYAVTVVAGGLVGGAVRHGSRP